MPVTRPIPAAAVFLERAEARAILVEACLFDLQDAVDGLQPAAVASGLVADIGQDAVQRMMAEAFSKVPRVANGEIPHKKTGAEYSAPHRGVAASTLAAAEYLIRQNDPAGFKAWLAKHSATECKAIIEHIRGGRR